jgi:uncharacterized protein
VTDSPWGALAVADAHIHFLSHHFCSMLAAQKPGMTLDTLAAALEWQIPPEQPEALAQIWTRELDRYGVERAVLIATLPGDETSVTAAVAAFPPRFFAYAMVNPAVADTAPRIQGALDGGLHGLCFFPAMHRYSMHEENVLAILDLVAATRPRTVVFVHCGVLSVGFRAKLGLASPFDMRYSNPVELHAVALRYPQIRFVIPHFGAGYFREALMVADLCPNVYLDTSSSNRWMRYEHGLDLRGVFRRALEVVGPGRLLFGTDSSFFPRGWQSHIFESQAKALYELGVKADDAALIFGENLRRMMAE